MSLHRTEGDEHSAGAAAWRNFADVVSDPAKFAARFNSTVPGAYRCVTVDDIRAMVSCGLIGRHGFFERADVETVRGILRYEEARETATKRAVRHRNDEPASGEAELVAADIPGSPLSSGLDTRETAIRAAGRCRKTRTSSTIE